MTQKTKVLHNKEDHFLRYTIKKSPWYKHVDDSIWQLFRLDRPIPPTKISLERISEFLQERKRQTGDVHSVHIQTEGHAFVMWQLHRSVPLQCILYKELQWHFKIEQIKWLTARFGEENSCSWGNIMKVTEFTHFYLVLVQFIEGTKFNEVETFYIFRSCIYHVVTCWSVVLGT